MLDPAALVDSYSNLVPALLLITLIVWETVGPCFRYFVKRPTKRLRHGAINLGLGILNAIVIGVIFVTLWEIAVKWSVKADFGILRWVELSPWIEGLIAVLIFDCFTYWWHRFNHEVPFLWRFHRVHHSDAEMDVTTANRFHTGEIAISAVLRIPLLFLLGADLWMLAFYELLMFPVVQFHHANIRLPDAIERGFRKVFASPVMHKIHHSDLMEETNSNFTSLFSIWDRIFGTYRMRKHFQMIQLGLKEFRKPEDEQFFGMLKIPFRNAKGALSEDNRIETEREL
jgi:sterol desaturase/sphingolipid hydroxylase (fatty acid hydroxylase superfamily)